MLYTWRAGCNLLLQDVGKLFSEEITLCMDLLKFVVNHDGVFKLLLDDPEAIQLGSTAETRFDSIIYSVERILQDKPALFATEELAEICFRASNITIDLQAERERPEELLIYNRVAWDRLAVFVAVQGPLKILLRMTDVDTPNLSQVLYQFEQSSAECLLAAQKADENYPLDSSMAISTQTF